MLVMVEIVLFVLCSG